MDILNELKKSTLLITTNKIKNQILKEMSSTKRMIPVKFMTLEEFFNHYFFQVKKEAYFYLKNKEQKKISILEEEIKCLPYLINSNYKSEKLNHLKTILEDLEREDFLKKNPFFPSYLETVEIIVYGYHLDSFCQTLFSNLSARVIEFSKESKKHYVVYKFHDIEEEISYVGGEILKKIQSGVSIDQIKILSLPDEYRNPLRRIFKLLHLPVGIEEDTKLYETVLGQKTLKYLEDSKSLEEVIERVRNEFSDIAEVNILIDLLNDYTWYVGNPVDLRELIENDLKKKSLLKECWTNRIECVSKEEIEIEKEYFLLGFNQENIPKIYQDNDFLSDEEKRELGLFTSDEKNKLEREDWKNLIFKLPRLTITYKEKSAFGRWNPSLLIEKMEFEKVEMYSSYQNSNLYNEVLLAKYLDKLNKYGVIEENLSKLYYTYPNHLYMTYNNQFKGLERNAFYHYLDHKLVLSYSSIDNFYKCSFRYYLSNILKIDPFKSNFFTVIGDIFHHVLEHFLDSDFDFSKFFEEELGKYSFKESEKAFLNHLREELIFDIHVLKSQREYTTFQTEFHEEKFYLPIAKDNYLETIFMGIVDKIMILEGSQETYLAIVDYKTGSLPDNLNNTIYGIGMQLPVYLYLINRSNRFPSPKVVGIFLQKVINKEIKRNTKKDYQEEKKNHLKLVGFCLEEEELLRKLDISYENSVLIKSLKKGSNGFYRYSRVLSEEKFQKLEQIVHTKVEEADMKIRNADFRINPKRIGKDLIGCEFCKYKDICFRREEDIISLKEYKNLEFLGGEDDA